MDVRLEPWSESALALLRRINTPKMRHHVGGAESEADLLARHRRYLAMPRTGTACMYAVIHGDEMVGSAAYHQFVWQGERVYEAGWNTLPEYQGRGIATAASTALIAIVRDEARKPGAPQSLHAFPSVENEPSNALCRSLGFAFAGPCDFEYPRGSGIFMRSNDWRLDVGPAAEANGPGALS
jgi:RimJ/RimL family protein N-acetyltransferase